MKSFSKPTSDQIDGVLPMLSSPQHEAYFFDRLENPNWIAPLRERGAFDSPPGREPVAGGGFRLPSWHASKYLARMSPLAPSEVTSIFAELKTDNPRIIGDMLEAALAMPAEAAVQLVPNIRKAARSGSLWIYFKEASDFCVRLAHGGQLDSAMSLAKSLFRPSFAKSRDEPRRHDRYLYEKGLEEVVLILAELRAKEFLPKLCEWLSCLVRAKKHVNSESGFDLSYHWRAAIEEHEQNRDSDFAGMMVGFVREGFERAIRSGKLLLAETLLIVEQQSYLIFKRLRIHLINEFAEQNVELAQQIMMDRHMFDDYQFKHEYAMLVGRRLNLLTPEERSTWFGWVDAGPDMSDFDETFKQRMNKEPSVEDRQGRIDYWKFEKFHCVRKHLDRQRREFYERMLNERGEPELADLNVWSSGGRWGSESPMTVEQLAEKSFERAVDRVATWKPDKPHYLGPDVEGLAATFGQYLATNPVDFSKQAGVLIGRPAIYVRTFIDQMSKAVKAALDIDVYVVLNLCGWVVKQPVDERTSPAYDEEALVDKDWQWTRNEISRFIESVCKANTESGPRYAIESFRQPMWELLEQLCRDGAKSYLVDDISKDDPRLRDYLDLGINSSRGKAVEAAFEYARWVAAHIKQGDEKKSIVPGGFDAMPEVRQMLERQIAPGNRNYEALSIIGAYIATINWIDKPWLEANAERLFDLQGIERTPPAAEGWAAWNAFLVWSRPHFDFYKLLKSQFAYAVEHTTKMQPAEQSREQPMYHLGEHLMLIYGRGQLDFDDDDGLLRKFLLRANPDIRRHAIGFVGESLQGDQKVPAEIVSRFQQLWDFYWDKIGKKDAAEEPDAILFGPWFASGQFPNDWALERLEQYVGVVPTPIGEHEIVEQLAKVAATDAEKSIGIFDRMVRGDREGWRLSSWEDLAGQILEIALKSGGNAKKLAVELINFLGRRGYLKFGELLHASPT